MEGPPRGGLSVVASCLLVGQSRHLFLHRAFPLSGIKETARKRVGASNKQFRDVDP